MKIPRWSMSMGVILLALQTRATSALEFTSACSPVIQENTISFFSHAPLTFSFEIPSASACATRCGEVSSCRAWLYSSSGKECQLYREQPRSQAKNPLFISGLCTGSSSAESPQVSITSSSRIRVSSHGLNQPQQPTPSTPAKRNGSEHLHRRHDHDLRHQHHHHHHGT
ncbi:PAN domain-containing protein [Aspergillus homomorphus CBS 101889]|uniref:Apple domain-containing protein n=1 Tax=Aspergillus homomorphus (strain CBS 101889) TaxID=1450537 RepID=A0A395HFU3_ASPHC|nr:hypothetical protein BO97DRAFT_447318 [Aspergillus homomorphus CBS 101889]RAL06772.1 hypothetical protein BO97DRAFT_447318 [Aspergillus homomorphus CBS 101889]